MIRSQTCAVGAGCLLVLITTQPLPGAEERVVAPAQSPAPLLVDIRLTGITSLPPAPAAYFVVAEPGKEPFSRKVTLGAKTGAIEVKEIDFASGRVGIRYNGVPLALTFSGHAADDQFYQNIAERLFVAEHTRAHEELEQREVEQALRERAAAEKTGPTPPSSP